MENKISVIIPVYNVEKYLDKCIESVVNQTYSTLEILLVNDGSKDASPQICDKWALRDSRIRVIHKQNGGQAEARNAALDICTGKYIVFVDSDDYVDPEYIAYLYQLICENAAELAICEYRMITFEGRPLNSFADNGQVLVMDQQQALWELCNEKLFSSSPCAKIYLNSLFQSVRFPVGHIFEDLAIVYKLFLQAETVAFGKRALYNYIRREDSTMTTAFTLKKLDAVVYTEEMCEVVTSKWPRLEAVATKKCFTSYVHCLSWIVLSGETTKEIQAVEDALYYKIKVVRKKTCMKYLSQKMKCYKILSYFGKTALKMGINFMEQLIGCYKRI